MKLRKMTKIVIGIFVLFTTFGFTFPKDIGIIDPNDIEYTKESLAHYFHLKDPYEFTEGTFHDGSYYYDYSSGKVSITLNQDKETISDITISSLNPFEAERFLKDLGIYPDVGFHFVDISTFVEVECKMSANFVCCK